MGVLDSGYYPKHLSYIFVITLLLFPTWTSAFLGRHLLMFITFVPGIKVPITVLLDVKKAQVSTYHWISTQHQLRNPTCGHPSAVPWAQESIDVNWKVNLAQKPSC